MAKLIKYRICKYCGEKVPQMRDTGSYDQGKVDGYLDLHRGTEKEHNCAGLRAMLARVDAKIGRALGVINCHVAEGK